MIGRLWQAHMLAVLAIGLTAAAALWPTTASAQPLGTFRWQMQPHCNVLTVTVSPSGGVYALDGFDDQCGADTVAPLIGTAVVNPGGTVTLAMTIVTSPGVAAVHVTARLHVGSLDGTWQDSAGASGGLSAALAARSSGTPRPSSSGTLVTAAHVNATQVQLRIVGTCPGGQSMQRIQQDGSAACGPASAGGGDVTAVTTPAGGGLQGGTESGVAGLRVASTASGAFDFGNNGGFVTRGTLGISAPAATSGPGTRMLWHPAKAAFRAGHAIGSEWDDASIGQYSVAMGRNVTASSSGSIALGESAFATAEHAVAIGSFAEATAPNSVAIGRLVWVRPSDRGAIIIADGAPLGSLTSSAPNQFSARAAGGYRFFTSSTAGSGVTLAANGNAWAPSSDVNVKENFRELDGEAVLEKIARMPIREWNYKTQDAALRHIGPTAQDFDAAFGLGEDPLRINTINADGIILRTIQALEVRTRAHRERLAHIERELAGMR